MREYQRESRIKADPMKEALLSEMPIDMQGEVDLQKQLVRLKEIIRMDITNIREEVVTGKLKASSTESVGLYARLLTSMIKEEKDYLDKLSDEELEKLSESDQTRKA